MKLSSSLLGLFLFLVTLIPSAWFVLILPYSRYQQIIDQLPGLIDRSLIQNFPPNLTITVKNGQVTYNRPGPFCLTVSSRSIEGIVFDNSATQPQNYLSDYQHLCQPLALVGDDFFVYPDQSSGLKIQKIDPNLNLEINRQIIDNFVTTALPFVLKFSSQAYYWLPFLVAIFLFPLFLLNNLWYASVARFASRFFGHQLSFQTAYANSLFIYTLLIFIDNVVINYLFNHLLGTSIHLTIPFLNTLIISILANLMSKKSSIDQQSAPLS